MLKPLEIIWWLVETWTKGSLGEIGSQVRTED